MSETVINVTHVRNGNSNNNQHHPNHIYDDASNLNWIKFNVEYFVTADGILKLIQLVRFKFNTQMFLLLSLNLERIKHLFGLQRSLAYTYIILILHLFYSFSHIL